MILTQKQYKKLVFLATIDLGENTIMFFIIEKVKETILDFSQEPVKLLQTYFARLFLLLTLASASYAQVYKKSSGSRTYGLGKNNTNNMK